MSSPLPTLKRIKGGVTAARGFQASAVSAGIKNPAASRLDIGLIYSTESTSSAAAFTTNRVKAAPVKLSQTHFRNTAIRAIIANSGNANACTGLQGLTDAKAMVESVAQKLNLRPREIGICSTGVIGFPLPMSRIEPTIPTLVEKLDPKSGADVAAAIITSDTHTKEYAVSIEIDGHRIRIGGCAKGAGMISPSMATMLCFITTDATITKTTLEKATLECVENSFNRITIDGDMSTNDTVMILANGKSGMPTIKRNSKGCRIFRQALQHVMLTLAQMLVKDGERVTKFVTVNVKGALTYLDAKKVAEAVANSALVKSSWNGEDPNWGRVIHAIGYSRARIREELIDIHFEDKPACLGGLQAETPMNELRKIAAQEAFTITINLNRGKADYEIYSSDLSPEYIDFNRSEYAYWKQARKDGLV